MEAKYKPVRIFVDSSVFFAAVLSPTGGSFRILHEAQVRQIHLYVSYYVVTEVIDALLEKYPLLVSVAREYLRIFPFTIIDNPSRRAVKSFRWVSDQEDAPIVAAAVKCHADILLTLDHELSHSISGQRNLSLRVLTPGDFIQEYFI